MRALTFAIVMLMSTSTYATRQDLYCPADMTSPHFIYNDENGVWWFAEDMTVPMAPVRTISLPEIYQDRSGYLMYHGMGFYPCNEAERFFRPTKES